MLRGRKSGPLYNTCFQNLSKTSRKTLWTPLLVKNTSLRKLQNMLLNSSTRTRWDVKPCAGSSARDEDVLWPEIRNILLKSLKTAPNELKWVQNTSKVAQNALKCNRLEHWRAAAQHSAPDRRVPLLTNLSSVDFVFSQWLTFCRPGGDILRTE